MEILSPSNWLYDRREKMQGYQAAGVTEYWLIDPRAMTIEVYVLEQGAYVLTGQYRPGEVAPSRLLPGFAVSVEDIFSFNVGPRSFSAAVSSRMRWCA